MKIVRGASVCLLDEHERVSLIPREKEPFRGALAFPGGAVEEGESPLEAARRELSEETGHRAVGDPRARAHVEIVHNDTRYHIDCFAFTEWIAGEGDLAVRWLTIDEALASDLAPGVAAALVEIRNALRQ